MTALPTHLFEALDHVGIAVTDLDEAIAFYRDTYGMTLAHEETNPEQGVREAMMTVGDPEHPHSHIQLLAPLDESSTIAKFIDKNGPGLQQMAVRVTDIDAVMAHLAAHDIRVLYPEPKKGTAHSRINFVHPKDAGGVLLELTQPGK